jgi:hypothetical protein
MTVGALLDVGNFPTSLQVVTDRADGPAMVRSPRADARSACHPRTRTGGGRSEPRTPVGDSDS